MTSRIGLAVLALAAALLPSLSSATDSGIAAPRISVQQLRSALSSPSHHNDRSRINLHRILYDSHGILRIAVEDGFSDLRKRALSHLCDCPTFGSSSSSSSATGNGAINTFEEALKSHPNDLQQINLPDGTVRRTLATATVGFDMSDASNSNGSGSHHAAAKALELPSWVQDTCGQGAYNSFEDLRDVVSDVVDMFVKQLDQERGMTHDMNNEGENNVQSYGEILSGANHLEHFHVYTKSKNSGGDSEHEGELQNNGGPRTDVDESNRVSTTLDFHTDAGFFLSFVPAMNCHSYTADNSSFFLKGKKEPVTFEEDEVVIMLGAGAQYWLPSLQSDGGDTSPFLATSHALRLLQDTHRTWYGKMHLLPSSFTSSNTVLDAKSREALSSFQLEDYDAHVPSSQVDGCGTTVFNENTVPTLSSHDTAAVQKQSRRRLQHVSSPATCNNQTNFFCWYQCIDIPKSENAEQYVQSGLSLYCLDPGILSSSDNSIPDATAPCKGGYVHNSNCVGFWQKTDKSVPGYKLPYEVDPAANSVATPDNGDGYCYDGTSMYMDGFTWQGSTCVIYLFESWTLTTPFYFALAAIGSILVGIALELVLWKRRSVYALPPGTTRLCLSALVYGIQLTMGYFIMLVIMTYSAPLFISTIGGMMVGHTLFNAQDSFVNQWEEKHSKPDMDEVADEHGDSGAEGTSSHTEFASSSYQNGSATTNDEVENGCCGGSAKSPPERKIPPTESTRLRGAVADGATPCCQYTL